MTQEHPGAGPRPVEIIEQDTPYRGYFRIDRYRLRHRMFAGGWTGPIAREVFERGHAAAVLPYDPGRDEVVLIEQFRVGAFAAGMDPWLIEIVAGIIDEGESPEAVVRREALEEAGCEIGDLVPLGRFIVSPGGSSETVAIYCGRTESAGLGGIHGLDHEGEDIRAFVLPAVQAIALIDQGRVVNATSALALQWLALNRAALRARWAP